MSHELYRSRRTRFFLASRQHDHQAGWIADMLLDPRANPKSGKAIAIQKRRFGHGFILAENLPIFGAQSNRALPRLIGRLQPLATRIRPHKSPKSQDLFVLDFSTLLPGPMATLLLAEATISSVLRIGTPERMRVA